MGGKEIFLHDWHARGSREGRPSFSEEKETKRPDSFDAERTSLPASIKQKFFGSFFQKRTASLSSRPKLAEHASRFRPTRGWL
jgi:hypothetical protein